MYPIASDFLSGTFQRFILSRIGTTMSKDGRLPGSSFMQIRMSFARCGEMPGGMLMRKSSRAI